MIGAMARVRAEDLDQLAAKLLDLSPSRLEILMGDRSRDKVIRITGLTQDEVHARLRHSS